MKFFSKILFAIFILLAFPQAGEAAFTPNKGYNNQTTGSNTNTWGVVLNSNFTQIDSNLGGTLSLSVAGNSNVTLSAAQAQNLIYNFTGVLTGNINVIFPAAGGLYYINNQTTGAYTLTIQAGTSSSGILVPQGQSIPIVVDNSTSPPTVDGATGTQYNFVANTVGGTANALTISQTYPSNFTLNTGTFITFTPAQLNTASATLNVDGTGAVTIKKVNFPGLTNLVAGDLSTGPVIAQYNGTNWVALNIIPVGYETTVSTAQSVAFGNAWTPYVNTSAVTYTIDETTNLLPYWYIDVNALGGTATITPNAADSINVNGVTLSAGTSYKIPQGNSARIITDANGNLFINYNGNNLNTESTLASATTTDLGTTASNIIDITGTTTITGFGSSASAGNPLYFLRFAGALTLTYNSTSLIIPGSANITTAAGDTAIAKYEGSGNWRVLSYNPASGKSVVSSGGNLEKSIITATGSNTFTTPSNSTTSTVYKVTLTAGGGAGSGGATAQGGSGGETIIKWVTGLSPSTGYTVVIGTGGTGGSGGGGNGADSTFTDAGPTTYTAHAGTGGSDATAAGPVGGSGGNGDINIPGGNGGNGYTSTSTGKGGGGGGTFWGPGAADNAAGSSLAGVNAAVFGGGGSGAGGGASANGGSGKSGVAMIEWVL